MLPAGSWHHADLLLQVYYCRLRQFFDYCCTVDCVQGCLYTVSPIASNHRRLRLQWAHKHKAWQSDWHQVVFSDESRFNSWDHDGRIPVRRYASERCLPGYVIERYNGLTPGSSGLG
ncbi:transposable element Tcb1 transposase [Trichonephila clavipes]|uniref:Transposable element Tcb1 transposase n=1 Tax=Trichonephila clavipes TaxID=2585209 RepID=A0A8X6S3K1_TRICX|nr:transposable element Tcb1 transposase [Trichonephila clavipes]